MNKETKSNEIENKNNIIKNNIVIYQNLNNQISPSLNNNNNDYTNQNTANKIFDTFSDNNNNKSNIENNIDNNENNIESKKTSKSLTIKKIFILTFLFLSLISTIIILYLKFKKNSTENFEENSPINPIQTNIDHIDSEFAFKFDLKDLKHIFVEQNYTEKVLTNGNESTINVQRKTYYEIFIISAENSTEKNKNFYNKKYTLAILINNQCISTNKEKCLPKKMLNIKNINKNTLKKTLKKIDEIQNFNSIPLCLFNITDNDVITSYKCPEKLQMNIIQNMILDIYFFRPPAIKRPDKIRGNITIKKWKENNKYYVNEKNGGICDVSDSFESFCTTEMNSTLDLNGNLLNYDEIATTDIFKDEDNYFYKIKNTKLIDNSKNEKVDLISYEEILMKIISKLNFKYKEEFSNEKFKILYDLSKKNLTENEKKRNLNENENFSAEEELINIKHFGGVKTIIKLKNEINLNSENIKAISNLIIDGTEKEISNLKEFSNVGEILKKLIKLSKSGNEMLIELFDKINENFDNFSLIVDENMKNLNEIINFNDLTEIFGFSIENDFFSMLNESFILNEKIEKIFDENEIENKIKILNDEIKIFVDKNNFFIDEIFINIENLIEILNSTFLLNFTFSFDEIIKNSEEILNNYSKNEKKIIFDEIKIFFDDFEKNLTEKEKIIENLILKIENKNFDFNATENEINDLKFNLKNVKKNLNEINKKIKEKINNEIFNNFINENEKNHFEIIKNFNEILKKFDYENFDKNFSNSMKNFKENFTKILMNFSEEFLFNENFIFEENFDEIFTFIKNENENYLKNYNKILKDFINENENYLNEIILNLTFFFSEEKIENLIKIFDKNLINSFEKINFEFEINKILTFEYFEIIKNISNENSLILNLLKSYKTDKTNIKNRLKRDDFYVYFQNFKDTINSKFITDGYLMKYLNYKKNFDEAKNFFSNDFLNEIKNEFFIVDKIKNSFDKINFENLDLNFINKNNEKINDLNEKIKNFFNEKFNNFFLPKINEFKINKLNEIENNLIFIENNNNEIINKTSNIIINDFQNDFCVDFLRKKTYTCTNGAIYYYKNTDNYCFYLPESNNHNYLKKISKPNFNEFFNDFNEFYEILNFLTENYYLKIEEFKNKIFDLNENFFNEIYKKIEEFKNKIENILNEKKLIIENYDYFLNKTNEKMNFLFENLEKNSIELFSNFKIEILNNLKNYKISIDEFEIESKIIKNILIENVTKNFYDSIILHQKNEFNFSINFYYDCLLKNINSTFQKILNQNLLIKNENFNSNFNEIFNMIFNSKNLSLNLDFQLNSIKNSENDFFKTNEKFNDFKLNLNSNLTKLINEISQLKNEKINDDFSLKFKFYLENSDNLKQIEIFNNEIDNNFIILNLENFKEKLFENSFFSKENFIHKINENFLNSNLEISKKIQIKIKEISFSLENLISNYFSKEEIIIKINEFFNNSIYNLNQYEINEINLNFEKIIEKINEILLNEEKNLNSIFFNKNFSKINETKNEIKSKIFIKINKTIFNILDEIYNKIYLNIYENYVEYNLNLLNENVNFLISNFEETKFLNSTFDFKEIIKNILNDLINDYKFIIKSQINFKYNQNYKNIFNKINLNSIEKKIDEKFNEFFKNLENFSNEKEEKFYDLNEENKNEINENLEINIKNINEIIKKIKNNNFEININNFIKPDFSRINLKIDEIKFSFDNFIFKEKINEKNDFNEFIKNLIKSNLNIKNLFYFYEKFFDKIIFFNENFNINNLFFNLKSNFFQTFFYYLNLFNSNEIKTLTNDLKNQLFNFNDLDKIIIKNNKKIIEILNEKIYFFIENLKFEIIEKLKIFFTDFFEFDDEINKKIKENFNFVIFEIENDLNIFLNEFFNKKIIEPYLKILNENSNEIFIIINNQKKLIKEKFDDFSFIETNEILNEINNKINKTQISIKNYYENLKFKISDEFIFYFENFQKEKINKNFEYFLNLNLIMKNEIFDNIEKKSILYEKNYDKNKILLFLNDFNNEIKNNFEKMKNSIFFYGIDEYENNLNKKIQKMRILNENLSEKKIADKSIDETFQKLLNNSKKINFFIKNFEKFDEFDNIIQNNIEKLFSSYNNSKNNIKNNNFEEEENFLINKLENLTNFTFDYYNKINESFYNNKIYILNSIEEIDFLLNLCANKTFSTFAKKYYEISNISQSKTNEIEEFEEEIIIKEHEILSQNMQYYANINLTNIKKKADFKFIFDFDEINNLKMPKIYAHIINLSRPKKMNLEIYNKIGSCGKNVENYEFNFNNVNFSLILDFNTDSNDIIYTVITDIESFNYTEERYLIENLPKNICLNEDHENNNYIVDICLESNECLEVQKKIIIPKSSITVDKKYYKNVVRIFN